MTMVDHHVYITIVDHPVYISLMQYWLYCCLVAKVLSGAISVERVLIVAQLLESSDGITHY